MPISHWDGWSSIEGRHLLLAFGFVFAAQFGYFGWVVRSWIKLHPSRSRGQKKAARPV